MLRYVSATSYVPNCDVLWIGSYPLRDPRMACRRILKEKEVLLHWPQLPKRSVSERMIPQTLAALKTADGSFPRGTASGWSAMWTLIGKRGLKATHFKTHLTGPFTLFGRGAWGGGAEAVRFRVQVQRWFRHAYWQIDRIKEHGLVPVVVIDEPLLPELIKGTRATTDSVRPRRMLGHLAAVLRRLKRRGALTGVHCCNRVAPGALIDTGADLIHFDAHHFPTQVQESLPRLREFLRQGGIVAWGIVPTTETLDAGTRTEVEKRLFSILTNLAAPGERHGLPLRAILAQSMVAPTCGTGLLSTEQSGKILEFAGTLSRQLKSLYKL